MRIALAQLNPTVGDIAANTQAILDAIEVARGCSADVLVTSELAVLGYPPRDLLLRQGVVVACERAVQRIAAHVGADMHVIIGHPRRCPGGGKRGVRNSASICHDGAITAVYDKRLLPGYDVFDEDRYFDPGDCNCIIEITNRRVGILICEDLWQAGDVDQPCSYPVQPVRELAAERCDLVLALNASPFVLGKWDRHVKQLGEAAAALGCPIAAVNQVGGFDDLVFDGRSVLVDQRGSVRTALPGWREEVCVVDLDDAASIDCTDPATEDHMSALFHALSLGLGDYVHKTGNIAVLLGLSGGIDSAVTAAIAAHALGPHHVHGLLMPSRYSSPGSLSDATLLAEALGMDHVQTIDIEPGHEQLRSMLAPALGGEPCDVTDENIQARLRGVLLMAVSNAGGKLVLATGNKSELAVGYSTLYGDMCGAISPIGDVLKTQVYELARWINANHASLGWSLPPIPDASITKPPSAELRPNQTDQDTLPPYDLLDEIIDRRVNREQTRHQILCATGFDDAIVDRTLGRIGRAQYKRDQAAVIFKVSPRTFGRGRPMPIVSRWRDASQPEPGDDGTDAASARNGCAVTREEGAIDSARAASLANLTPGAGRPARAGPGGSID